MKIEEAMRLGALRALDAGIDRCEAVIKKETTEVEHKNNDGVVDWQGTKLSPRGELASRVKENFEAARADIATMRLD